MNKPRLVLSTVGTSLLRYHLTDEQRRECPSLPIRLANEQKLSSEDNANIDAIAARAKQTLQGDNINSIRKASAELNGVYAIYKNQIIQGRQDYHILIATDTALGQRCAKLVEEHLYQQHGISVFIPPIKELTTATTKDFEAGSKNLITWCDEVIPEYNGYTIIFNLVGGFKVIQSYLNIIGMFYADQILYLFEGTWEPIWIPCLPIKVDLDTIKDFQTELAMMAEADAIIPVTKIDGLSTALYDADETNAVISDWGMLIWQRICKEVLGGELLPFPRLRYENSFISDVKSKPNDRVQLQSCLAKVATILEQSNGNTAKLKESGGFQYDNYTKKKLPKTGQPIGHFRVSQELRVSCIAEDGGLTLRHFGNEPVVNANP